ncbi:unnamed protein product [Cuscuta europaea]|uniref:Uncharacterized protein n=1 Tax=Cuscuta europaea TaxID=41803 RepID=A0A9P1EJR8_CUSEU|nr:unnamed protein product [Cuscuta europaea]
MQQWVLKDQEAIRKYEEKGKASSQTTIAKRSTKCVCQGRGLCSLTDDGWSDQYKFSSAKISDVTSRFWFDSDKSRKSWFKGDLPENKEIFLYPRSISHAKESDSFTSAMYDESRAPFIDITHDLSSLPSQRFYFAKSNPFTK